MQCRSGNCSMLLSIVVILCGVGYVFGLSYQQQGEKKTMGIVTPRWSFLNSGTSYNGAVFSMHQCNDGVVVTVQTLDTATPTNSILFHFPGTDSIDNQQTSHVFATSVSGPFDLMKADTMIYDSDILLTLFTSGKLYSHSVSGTGVAYNTEDDIAVHVPPLGGNFQSVSQVFMIHRDNKVHFGLKSDNSTQKLFINIDYGTWPPNIPTGGGISFKQIPFDQSSEQLVAFESHQGNKYYFASSRKLYYYEFDTDHIRATYTAPTGSYIVAMGVDRSDVGDVTKVYISFDLKSDGYLSCASLDTELSAGSVVQKNLHVPGLTQNITYIALHDKLSYDSFVFFVSESDSLSTRTIIKVKDLRYYVHSAEDVVRLTEEYVDYPFDVEDYMHSTITADSKMEINAHRWVMYFTTGDTVNYDLEVRAIAQGCATGRIMNSESFSCLSCTRGSASKGGLAEGSSCPRCEAGKYANNTGEIECSSCSVGQYSAITGSYTCNLCPAGSYIDIEGSMFCDSCSVGSWQSDSGKASCTDCEANTETPGKGSTSAESCYPKAGYWLIPGTTNVIACSPSYACKGGEDNECADGYSGYRCGECSDEYYRMGIDCNKCTGTSTNLIILVGFAFILILLGMTGMAGGASNFKSLSISMNYLQMIALMSVFNLPWPKHLQDFLDALSVINFNLQLAQPECQNETLKQPFNRWILSALALPLAVLFGLFLVFLVMSCVWCCKKCCRKEKSNKIVPLSKKGPGTQSEAVIAVLASEDAEAKKLKQYNRSHRAVFHRSVGAVLIFLAIGYIFLGQSVLKVFDCKKEDDGSMMYEADPSVKCFDDSEHMTMVYAALGLIPIYVVGIPLFVVYFVRKNSHRLSTPKYSRLVGYLAASYQRRYCNWEVVVMMRKIAIVSCALFLSNYPLFSASLSALVLFASIIAHVWAQPQVSYRTFKEEGFLLINSFFVMLSGMMFLAPFPSEDSRDGAGWLIIGIIVLGLLTIILNLLFEGWCALKDLDFVAVLIGRQSRLKRSRRLAKEYAYMCVKEQHMRDFLQWTQRARLSDLETFAEAMSTMRLSSKLLKVYFDTDELRLLEEDADKKKKKEKKKKKKNKEKEKRSASEAERRKELKAIRRQKLAEIRERKRESLLISNIADDDEEGNNNDENPWLKDTVLSETDLKKTKMFTVDFRIVLCEWASSAKDQHVRLFQHMLEVLCSSTGNVASDKESKSAKPYVTTRPGANYQQHKEASKIKEDELVSYSE